VNKTEGILELLEQSCQNFKEQVAIQQNDKQITYAVLDERANRLAHCLINQLPKGSMIVVMLEDRINLIIALIAILRASCVFVPLDPTLPAERLRKMVTALIPDGFITAAKFNQLLPNIVSQTPKVSRLLYLEEHAQPEQSLNNILSPIVTPVASFRSEKPSISLDNEAICYIYHTSGSTGTPKGIMGRLKSISHFVKWEIETFNITAGWRISQLTMPTFDAFLRDVFVPLAVGGTICLPPEPNQPLDSQTLVDWIDKQRLNLVHCVPSLFKIMLEGSLDSQRLKSLKYILMAGEVLPIADVKKWIATYANRIQLVNLYGSSETTMVKFCHFIQPSDIKRGFIPIGQPITSTKAIILDDNQDVCPPGIFGELYIRTPYLTLGYYKQPELTQKVFIQNSLNQNPKDIIYKTGDLARILSDGHFQFLGRKDNQIKIIGIRIELADIEKALMDHEEIKNAIVKVWEDSTSEQRLIAYIVAASESVPTEPTELQHFLKEKLPAYMIPSTFVTLKTIPLTPHGKIDRQALPKPPQIRPQLEASFVAPQSKLELQLTKIWEKLLGIQSIGIHDNFFDLGGHSLLAIKLLAKIEKTFGKRLALIELFHAPTIAQQAARLTEERRLNGKLLETIQSQGNLSPFFFIGSTNYARALAPKLGDNQPVYGLNIFGLQPDNGKLPVLKVKKIAQQYCQKIQTVQPKGPYYLGGYCADAKVAFEIAQQLQANGQKVTFLAFIDVIWQPQNRYFGFYRHWYNLLEKGPNYLFYKMRKKINYLHSRLKLSWSQQIENFYQRWGKQSPRQLRNMLFINNYYTALKNYEPQPYQSPITLFLSSDWRWKDLTTLKKLAIGGLDIHEIAGYHDNLFDAPQINQLGKQLKSCLEKQRS
jgi:amino acid adenylation domain-containing protein